MIDIAVAGAGIIALSPLLLLIASVVRLQIGSPVLFRQVRPGYLERPFTLLKFRTMSDARDSAGGLLPDSQRLTRLGRLLRSTSLDELPELVNVLRGEMSLVGPRPLLVEYLPRYSAEQRRRHLVPPGLTGWAQVHGRNDVSWEHRLALDVWYVDNWSLALDARIIAQTFATVMSRRGVSHQGHETMPVFQGSTGRSQSRAQVTTREQ